MSISERVRNMVRNWLRIQPADVQGITIREAASFETNCMRNRVWYRGDAAEIEQLFKALGSDAVSTARFWAAAPSTSDVRKAHSGVPGLMVNTLAYLVKSDLNKAEFESKEQLQLWEEIERDCGFAEVVGGAVSDVLALGDGAFKISFNKEVSKYPILEFWPADRVEYEMRHGRIVAVVFKTPYHLKNATYELQEVYRTGSVTYHLYDGEKEIPLQRVAELNDYKNVSYSGDFSLAIPLCVFKSQRYPGRGRSIFDNKTDAFDAHDEIISQWIDAVRAGRVREYIPDEMIPRNPKTGELMSVDTFGSHYIRTASSNKENAVDKIDVTQPDIKYEAFLQSYTTTLDMCLQGIVSPATLGIDIGKMASADAQREKKDVTGYTRNAITDALEKVLPEVVRSMLLAYDTYNSRSADIYKPKITFGEYAAPDFNDRIETLGKASSATLMSVETLVDELWGASKEDDWKAQEVKRLKEMRGIEIMDEPSVGGELIDVE